jgi:hypothetical protein
MPLRSMSLSIQLHEDVCVAFCTTKSLNILSGGLLECRKCNQMAQKEGGGLESGYFVAESTTWSPTWSGKS